MKFSTGLDISMNLKKFETKILIVLSFLHAYSFGVIVINLPSETPLFQAPFRFEVHAYSKNFRAMGDYFERYEIEIYSIFFCLCTYS